MDGADVEGARIVTKARDRTGQKSNGGYRHDGRSSLQYAALGSPLFQESWCAGAPLNWVEFVGMKNGSNRSPRDAHRASSDDGGS
jgi:hypothetical protein